MKKILLFMIILAVSIGLMGLAPVNSGQFSLKTFTVNNKSGGPIDIRLVPATDLSQNTYYLSLETDETKIFTVLPNEYHFYVTYFKTVKHTNPMSLVVTYTKELKCHPNENFKYDVPVLDLTTNYKRTILPCDGAPPKDYGERAMDKFYFPNYLVPVVTNEYDWTTLYQWDYLYDTDWVVTPALKIEG